MAGRPDCHHGRRLSSCRPDPTDATPTRSDEHSIRGVCLPVSRRVFLVEVRSCRCCGHRRGCSTTLDVPGHWPSPAVCLPQLGSSAPGEATTRSSPGTIIRRQPPLRVASRCPPAAGCRAAATAARGDPNGGEPRDGGASLVAPPDLPVGLGDGSPGPLHALAAGSEFSQHLWLVVSRFILRILISTLVHLQLLQTPLPRLPGAGMPCHDEPGIPSAGTPGPRQLGQPSSGARLRSPRVVVPAAAAPPAPRALQRGPAALPLASRSLHNWSQQQQQSQPKPWMRLWLQRWAARHPHVPTLPHPRPASPATAPAATLRLAPRPVLFSNFTHRRLDRYHIVIRSWLPFGAGPLLLSPQHDQLLHR